MQTLLTKVCVRVIWRWSRTPWPPSSGQIGALQKIVAHGRCRRFPPVWNSSNQSTVRRCCCINQDVTFNFCEIFLRHYYVFQSDFSSLLTVPPLLVPFSRGFSAGGVGTLRPWILLDSCTLMCRVCKRVRAALTNRVLRSRGTRHVVARKSCSCVGWRQQSTRYIELWAAFSSFLSTINKRL